MCKIIEKKSVSFNEKIPSSLAEKPTWPLILSSQALLSLQLPFHLPFDQGFLNLNKYFLFPSLLSIWKKSNILYVYPSIIPTLSTLFFEEEVHDIIKVFLSASYKFFTISILYSVKTALSLFSVSYTKLLIPVKNSNASIGVQPIIFQ